MRIDFFAGTQRSFISPLRPQRLIYDMNPATKQFDEGLRFALVDPHMLPYSPPMEQRILHRQAAIGSVIANYRNNKWIEAQKKSTVSRLSGDTRDGRRMSAFTDGNEFGPSHECEEDYHASTCGQKKLDSDHFVGKVELNNLDNLPDGKNPIENGFRAIELRVWEVATEPRSNELTWGAGVKASLHRSIRP